MEFKEKRDRVDDAVCATRAAMEEGILPGGGVALYNASSKVLALCDVPSNGKKKKSTNGDQAKTLAATILFEALSAPYFQILSNAGMDASILEEPSNSKGWDVKAMKYVDMYRSGIIDPTKVTVCALRNAVSVAITILSTNAIITNK